MTLDEIIVQLNELGFTDKQIDTCIVNADVAERWLLAAKARGAKLTNPAGFVWKGISSGELPLPAGGRPAAWAEAGDDMASDRSYGGMVQAIEELIASQGHEFFFDYDQANVRAELRRRPPAFLEKELRDEFHRYERKFGFGLSADDLERLVADCKARAKAGLDEHRKHVQLDDGAMTDHQRRWRLDCISHGADPRLFQGGATPAELDAWRAKRPAAEYTADDLTVVDGANACGDCNGDGPIYQYGDLRVCAVCAGSRARAAIKFGLTPAEGTWRETPTATPLLREADPVDN
jgi:hypothetical protein